MHSPLLSDIPNIRYGFGNAHHLVPASLSPYWHQVTQKKQVHGVRIVEVTDANQDCGNADGLFTRCPEIPISIVTADCVPVLFARRDGKMIAAVHAGWRGLRYGIIPALWQKLSELGEHPDNWVAAIGSHIGACCFEVSEDLAREFLQAYPEVRPESIQPRYRHLDLNAIAQIEIQKTGIHAIDNLCRCTRCTTDADNRFLYRSYRRGDRNSHQHTGLVILNTEV
jgi:YfiH family protein